MPIEDIKIQKAPQGWQPNSDQQRRIQSDPRLQRMSRDDLYFFFNQQEQGARRTRAQPPARRQPAPSSGVFGWIDSVTKALRGE